MHVREGFNITKLIFITTTPLYMDIRIFHIRPNILVKSPNPISSQKLSVYNLIQYTLIELVSLWGICVKYHHLNITFLHLIEFGLTKTRYNPEEIILLYQEEWSLYRVQIKCMFLVKLWICFAVPSLLVLQKIHFLQFYWLSQTVLNFQKQNPKDCCVS